MILFLILARSKGHVLPMHKCATLCAGTDSARACKCMRLSAPNGRTRDMQTSSAPKGCTRDVNVYAVDDAPASASSRTGRTGNPELAPASLCGYPAVDDAPASASSRTRRTGNPEPARASGRAKCMRLSEPNACMRDMQPMSRGRRRAGKPLWQPRHPERPLVRRRGPPSDL
jgi:hypothetical protein